MKQTSIYTAALAALMLIPAGCSDEQYDNSQQPGNGASGPLITVTATQGDRPQTRLGYVDPDDPTKPIEVTWAEKDQFYIGKDWSAFTGGATAISAEAASAYFSPFTLKEGGAGSKIGTFTGNLTGTEVAGEPLYGIYGDGARITLDKGEPGFLSFDYTNQQQLSNESQTHLSGADFMLATTSYIEGETPILAFTHLGAIIKFDITLPKTEMWVKQITLTTTDATKPFSNSVQWKKDGALAFSASKATSASTTLQLCQEGTDKGVAVIDNKLTAYMMVAPTTLTAVEMTGRKLLLKVTDAEGVVYGIPLTGVKIEQGKYYTVKAAVNKIFNEMKFTVKIANSNYMYYSLPFENGETIPYDITVDWGDNSEVELIPAGTVCNTENFKHTYPSFKEYTITITSSQTDPTKQQIPKLFFYIVEGLKKYLIRVDTPLLNTGDSDFSSCFSDCENLTSLPQGLFDNNTQVTDFTNCFYYCTNLASLPQGLFDKNTQATNFLMCFNKCTNLASLPQGLFDKNTKATNFSMCFQSCTNLTSLPQGLFDKNTKAANFNSCFNKCTKLVLNETIFSSTQNHDCFVGRKYNNNHDMNFEECFRDVGSKSPYMSKPPRLWEYTNGNRWTVRNCYLNCKAALHLEGIPVGETYNGYWGVPIL